MVYVKLLCFLATFSLFAYKELIKEDITPAACYLSGIGLNHKPVTAQKPKRYITRTDKERRETALISKVQKQETTAYESEVAATPKVVEMPVKRPTSTFANSAIAPPLHRRKPIRPEEEVVVRKRSPRYARRYRWIKDNQICDPCISYFYLPQEPAETKPAHAAPASDQPMYQHRGKTAAPLFDSTEKQKTPSL